MHQFMLPPQKTVIISDSDTNNIAGKSYWNNKMACNQLYVTARLSTREQKWGKQPPNKNNYKCVTNIDTH